MQKIIGPLTGLAALICGGGSAWAASPAYCALYANEFVKHAALDSQSSVPLSQIHDREYYKCLNMDDEPLLPAAHADAGNDASNDTFMAIEGAVDPNGVQVSKDRNPSATVDDTASFAPEPAAIKTYGKNWRGSGYPMWSQEWRAWCAQHFPNSFDTKTGTVVPYETGVRTICR